MATMDPRSLDFITRACQGRLAQGNSQARVQAVCTDSRHLKAGELFVALRGPRFDGHQFVQDAAHKHAAAILVDTRHPAPGSDLSCPLIVVEDTRAALGRLASRYRQDFQLPIVAVAGSNGKTTTKNILASILAAGFPTLASEASFNNDIGVPLTLLRLESRHQAAVLEVGTNHPGELAPLLDSIQPRFGVLTSLGPEHLEFFHSLEGVAHEEGFLAESLPASGRLFVNGDTPALDLVLPRCKAPVTRAGWSTANDWRVTRALLSPQGTQFDVSAPNPTMNGSYHLPLLGRHQVVNALLAMAVAAELGLNRDLIQAGLAACRPAPMRLQLIQTARGAILDDSYNANVDSMVAALDTCKDLPCLGKRIAVLGPMAELGEHSAQAHAQVGRHAALLGIDLLVCVGSWCDPTAQAARENGLSAVHTFDAPLAAVPFLKAALSPDDLLLLKASRAAGLERLRDALLGEIAGA